MEILNATSPNSPESSFSAFMYLYFALPSAIFAASASKLEILLYEKFAKTIEEIVAIINKEKATNNKGISEFTEIIFENSTPIPIDIETIMNVRNLYPII